MQVAEYIKKVMAIKCLKCISSSYIGECLCSDSCVCVCVLTRVCASVLRPAGRTPAGDPGPAAAAGGAAAEVPKRPVDPRTSQALQGHLQGQLSPAV